MSDFRREYVRFDALTRTLKGWAEKHRFVRLESLGESLEGRELWLLTIGPEPERARAAAWVDGNMHASEVAGSSVALAIAEDMIALHLEDTTPLREDHPARLLPKHVKDRLRETLLYVMPRVCPDGAEAVLETGRYVRSNPRDRRPHPPVARWVSKDVDGDGASLSIRREDPSGEWVEDPELPGVMLPRRLEDKGPFYKIWPEGLIESFDGAHVPDPYFLGDNDTDLNRNFPWSWMPEPTQAGAGTYPTSEPESRAIVEFMTTHPNVFSWMNLHTFGGVYIRPLGNAPDTKMDPQDLAVFDQVAEWGKEHGGYPTVSGYEQFTYEPDKPLHGDMADFGYHVRGAITYVCELWDLFARLGVAPKKKFVDYYTHLSREDLLALAKFDREQNQGRIFRGWKRAKHPQLGDVEVGGTAPLVGIFNPPNEVLAEVCARQSAAYLRVAAMAPALEIADVRTSDAGGAVRVDVDVRNAGYLPTYVLSSAKKLGFDARVFLEVEAGGGASVETRDQRIEVGHLEGWGRGLFASSIFYQRSRGTVSSRTVSFVVRGKGTLKITARGLRVGAVTREISV